MTAQQTDTEIILQARNVSKHFGGLVAVSEVTFDLPQGEILGLIGPNAGGKSTFLKLILGELEPLSGSVRVRPTGDWWPATSNR